MSVKQLVILSLVVIALVFLVTFASMYLGEGPKKSGLQTQGGPAQHLAFAEPLYGAPEADLTGGATLRHLPIQERQREGHHDYWFENVSGGPVKLGLVKGSCKCAKLEACIFAEDTWKKVSESERPSLADSGEWILLMEYEKEPRSVTVPPGGAGYVRMSWDGTQNGREELGATLWTEGPTGELARIVLQAQLLFLDSVICQVEENVADPTDPNWALMRLNEKNLGKLATGSRTQASFLCWSGTRADFPLIPPSKLQTPCISIDPPRKLNDEELKKLSKHVGLTVRGAYAVSLTIRDQTDEGQQLDLGRFRYQVDLKSNAVPSGFVSGYIMGEVEGPITVVGTEGQSRIDVGHFSMNEDKYAEIRLYTNQSDLEVKLDGPRTRATPFFQVSEPVEIPQAVGKSWRVDLKIPAGTAEGRFPSRDRFARSGYEDCAVYLTIHSKGEVASSDREARRFRIPIFGNATR